MLHGLPQSVTPNWLEPKVNNVSLPGNPMDPAHRPAGMSAMAHKT
jgi:hypothetical protein